MLRIFLFIFKVNEKHQNDGDRDSDIEIMIEKIISCKKEKREKFKIDVKKKFSNALNDIDTNIKSLIEVVYKTIK